MGYLILMILVFVVIPFLWKIFKLITYRVPRGSKKRVENFYAQMQNEAGQGFNDLIYTFFDTGIGYNYETNELYLKGRVKNQHNVSQLLWGVYTPGNIRSVRTQMSSESYITIEDHDFQNLVNKMEAEYNTTVSSGVFISTRDGRVYQIMLPDGDIIEKVSNIVALFKENELTEEDLHKYHQSFKK